jgi:hypothetical protein
MMMCRQLHNLEANLALPAMLRDVPTMLNHWVALADTQEHFPCLSYCHLILRIAAPVRIRSAVALWWPACCMAMPACMAAMHHHAAAFVHEWQQTL